MCIYYYQIQQIDRQPRWMDRYIYYLYRGEINFESRAIQLDSIQPIRIAVQIDLTYGGVADCHTHTHITHPYVYIVYLSLNVNQIESMYINVDKRNLCNIALRVRPNLSLYIINSFTTFSLLRLFFLFFFRVWKNSKYSAPKIAQQNENKMNLSIW